MKPKLMLCSGFLTILAAVSPVHATAYNFTLIAQTGGDYGRLTAGTINDAGTVAYAATLDNAPSWGYSQQQLLTTTTSGTTQVIADTSGSIRSFYHSDASSSAPQINNSGAVAVDVFYDDDEQGVVLFQNGVSTTIADTRGTLAWVGGRLLNDSGEVVYFGRTRGESLLDLYISDGSTPTKIAGTGLIAAVSLNDVGQVSYSAPSGTNTQSLYFGTPGATTEVAKTGSQFSSFRLADVNNEGNLVFAATLTDGSQALYSWHDGALSLIADTTAGFTFLGSPALNDRGELIFQAADWRGNGMFDGPDPIANRIIGAGDSLFGSTIAFTQFAPSLNSSGQFVFFAALTDGREVLVRADPIPEPATLYLFGLFLAFTFRGTRRH